MNRDQEQHMTVLNQVIQWRGSRKESSEVVIHFRDMNTKVFVWSFRDGPEPQHMVIHQTNRTFLKYETVGGELGSVIDRIDALYRNDAIHQQSLSLGLAS